MQDQKATSILHLIPGWILGLVALATIATTIYLTDLFLSAYQSAKIIERIEHHLKAQSTAVDISNDPTLAPVVNEQNEAAWKLLRRLAFIESGNTKGLKATHNEKKKKKRDSTPSAEIDELIIQQETFSNMADGLVSSIQSELGNLLTYARLTRLLQRSSLLIVVRNNQFRTSAEIATRSTALKDSTRQELLKNATPTISNNEAIAYNKLRPLLEPLLGSLPDIKQPVS